MGEDLIENAVYYVDGKIYKIRRTPIVGDGSLYAEQAVFEESSRWEYVGSAKSLGVKATDLMPHHVARDIFGTVGCCAGCLRPLRSNESLRRGYGPQCAANNGWPYDTNAD